VKNEHLLTHGRRNRCGEKLGILTVLHPTTVKPYLKVKRHLYWLCSCECGNKLELPSDAMYESHYSSCGCRKGLKTHGMSRTKEHECWKSMKARCYNENNKNYAHYGARGIKVFDQWVDDFVSFYEHIGPIPKDGKKYTLDRINTYGDYEPNNVRWVEQKYQCRNLSKNTKNNTGKSGVSTRVDNGIKSFVAAWRDLNGKCKSKQFSTRKYGDELARFLAEETRSLAIEYLNNNGAGYTERHGLSLEEISS